MSRRWSMSLALVLLSATAGRGDKLEVIQGTTGSRSDRVEVHAGGLVLRESEPGAAFGWVRLGKGKRQLSYFVVFKHRLGGAGENTFDEDVKTADFSGQSKQTVQVNDRKMEVFYKVELDRAGKVSRETLTINGKAADLTRGRVILADLTVRPVKWEQKKLKLPAGLEDTTSKKAADAVVKKLLASLAKQDRKTKTFLEEAKK